MLGLRRRGVGLGDEAASVAPRGQWGRHLSVGVPHKRKRRPLAMAPVHGQHTGFLIVFRAAQPGTNQALCDLVRRFLARLSLGVSTPRSRGHAPRFAPSLTGFPAGPWIPGPPRRSRTSLAALAALRSVSACASPAGARCASVTICRCPGLFPCAWVPQTREKTAPVFAASRVARITFPQSRESFRGNEIAQENWALLARAP